MKRKVKLEEEDQDVEQRKAEVLKSVEHEEEQVLEDEKIGI